MRKQSGNWLPAKGHIVQQTSEEPQETALNQSCITQSFVDDSIWSALDNVNDSNFSKAAYVCEPLLDEFGKSMENAKNWASIHPEAEPEPELHQRTSRKRSSRRMSGKIEDSGTGAADGLSHPPAIGMASKAPQPKTELTKSLACAKKGLPYIKGCPIGVTGYRFIHFHIFRTGNGQIYRGYNLRFPKVLEMKPIKAKDLIELIVIRKSVMTAWAVSNSKLTKHEIIIFQL
jgi:hypothetical protein